MKRKCFVPSLLFILALASYWLTANPLPSGYADSDELITAGHLFSSAHPPGYGLNILLVGLFQRLFFFVSPAYASNLLAGILHAITLVLLYLSAKKLIKPTIQQSLILAAGVLLTGWSSLFWLYSSVIEVMSLANLFCALTLYLSLSWYLDQKYTSRYVLLISIIFGAGVGHFQPLILIGPALAFLLARRQPRQLPKALGVTSISFMISSALILPLNLHQQPYSWDFAPNLNGLIRMITRQDYQGTFLDKNMVVENSYVSGFNWTFIDKIPQYIVTTWNHFAGLPLILIILGFYSLSRRKDKQPFYFLLLAYLISGLLFGSYTTVTDYQPTNLQYRLLVGTGERQYLLGYTVLGILSAIGLYQLALYLKSKIINIILTLTLLISVLIANFPMANQRPNSLVYAYASTMLQHAKPNSVIICASDFSCFSLYYQSLVEHKRPDVTVLARIPKGRQHFLATHPEFSDYLYPENPSFLGYLITYNLQYRPVYITSLDQFTINYFGINGNPFFANSSNYLVELSFTPDLTATSQAESSLINQLANYQPDQRDFHLLGFYDYLASYYQTKALYHTKYNQRSQAITALDTAIYLNENDPRVIDWRFKLDDFVKTLNILDQPATSSAQYLKQAQTASVAGQPLEAETAARKSYYLNPSDPQPLQFLRQLYQDHNYPHYATWISEHLSKLQP